MCVIWGELLISTLVGRRSIAKIYPRNIDQNEGIHHTLIPV